MSDEHGRGVVYLDASAIVKLVVAEPESAALRRYLRAHPTRASCALVRVEVVRSVAGHGAKATSRARALLERIHLLAVDDALLDAAAALPPPVLRSLDAIHLAAAQSFGADLHALVTYDRRMADAAGSVGLRCAAPA